MGRGLEDRLREAIRDVPDFPKPGIMFRDVTTLLLKPDLVVEAIDAIWSRFADEGVSHLAAVEARGFVVGAALALRTRLPLVLLRKPGKLPSHCLSEDYDLEYGRATLQVHDDALRESDRVLVVDDLLATGGTAAASGRLIRRCGATIAGYGFIAELAFLSGREKLADAPVHAILMYDA